MSIDGTVFSEGISNNNCTNGKANKEVGDGHFLWKALDHMQCLVVWNRN